MEIKKIFDNLLNDPSFNNYYEDFSSKDFFDNDNINCKENIYDSSVNDLNDYLNNKADNDYIQYDSELSS